MNDSTPKRLKELAILFLKLGTIGFGGPAAHIAMMQHEVVEKREWMDQQHFLDLMGATNLIPGPNSTEMAIHIGKERAGWKGLIVAGVCFILPATLITVFLAVLYKKYGQLPQVQPFIYGIKPAIIPVILLAIYPLSKPALKSIELWVLGIIALTLSLLNIHEIPIIFGAGFLFMAFKAWQKSKSRNLHSLLPGWMITYADSQFFNASSFSLFFTFLKIGAILYGSGYVLFAFLDTELVQTGIIDRGQLMDAIAVGQFTPGPVFSSVAFIGYQINNYTGAALATFGIFLPSFVFVALLNPIVHRLRKSALSAAFLDAVNVASVAIIIAICFRMGKELLFDGKSILILVLSMLCLFFFRKINSALIILGGAVLGYILQTL